MRRLSDDGVVARVRRSDGRRPFGRWRRLVAAAAVPLLGILPAVLGAAPAAQAATNYPGGFLSYEQTFFLYADAGEVPEFTFTQAAGQSDPVDFTVTDPAGNVQQTCAVPASVANGVKCTSTGLTASIDGIWTIHYDPNRPVPGARYSWDVEVVDGAGQPVAGRTWVESYGMSQSGAANLQLWVATREGYVYQADFRGYNGQGSWIRANGFGLVDAGTCTPIYRSVEGSISGANGVNIDPRYAFSDDCGDRYKLFLEAPAADLPAAAAIAGGTDWVRPAVVSPAAENLALQQDSPFTRAGEFTFDLSGVNGGYTVQLDTDANGSYADAVDRVIPWGSPPGAVTVPFDGLDGLGEPLDVCQAFNAKVVVDRVGETHLVLDDVESFGTSSVNNYGLRITGATPGVVSANPRVYWDDTALSPRAAFPGERVLPYADGREGIDTTTTVTGAHGWGQWGDQRSIENWTYYQAEAGAETTIAAGCAPALTLDKESTLDDTNGNGFADVDETITYTFDVRNTGNAVVADVTVADDRVSSVTPASVTLPVFGEQRFTAAPYVVTQADIDAGGVTNVASSAGAGPGGVAVVSNDDTEFVPTVPRDPSLLLDKQAELDDANGSGFADLGETIDYTFVVTNTGNVTLTSVSIDDPRVTGVQPASTTLAPGASATFTAAVYVVTQADLNTGSVDNTAVADGVSTTGPVRSNTDSTSVPTPIPDPQLVLEKTGVITSDAGSDGRADVGDVVTYTFEVSNTGTVDIADVTIDDPRVATVTPAAQDIPAGESRSFTATYVSTQLDVDSGSIPNTAFAEGTYAGPDGDIAVASAPDTAIVPTPDRAPSMTLEKEGTLADTNGNGSADAGETIVYTFTVTNRGNVTLTNVAPVDDRVAEITPGAATIVPGGSAAFTSTAYTVTQADVDAGEVLNTAFARGNVPGGEEVFTPTDDHVEATVAAAPALTIDKIATLVDGNGNETADEGEQITYAFVVTNAGNVTLTDVTVDDPRISALIPDAIDFLPPAASFTFEAEPYTVTAADVAAGEIVNVATASGLDPDQTPVESEQDSTTTEATPPEAPVEPQPTPPPGGGLAVTGADSMPALTLGIALLALGVTAGGAAALAKRRRSSVESN